MSSDPRIVIALGGNALGDNPAEQRRAIDAAAPALVGLIAQGYEIIVTHGNGPQVGAIHQAFATAAAAGGKMGPVGLAECTAMSQGYIGYQLQQGIARQLRLAGMPWHVATVVTQVEVAADDPAFGDPTKPVGAFVDEATARAAMAANPGVKYVDDAGRGWRRVVASPRPIGIVERDSILNLLDHEFIVIACGGGGVPVVRDPAGDFRGVEAVVDKDFAAATLAQACGAHDLFILTAVDRVAVGWGTPAQRDLESLSAAEAEALAAAGEFGAGSMLPKIRAAIGFVRSGPDRRATICSLAGAPHAMAGNAGTLIHA
ncbi:MAG: carbamate kinase [Bifidobacteriaceae bacterium]|jgi:carbamate kinase|nr:carbamate kinase [Bifidobacteriaceae bacterium]